jgi:exopolysaccharide biosynthesis polyprenyl glycosylphosphotransferase
MVGERRGARMTFAGTFLRRHFEPLMLSAQVVIDLAVVMAACWLGWLTRDWIMWRGGPPLSTYREVFLLGAAITLVCFHSYGMYSPLKSLLNIEEFKAIAKSTVTAFLVLQMMLIMLRPTSEPRHGLYEFVHRLFRYVDLKDDLWEYSRLVLVFAFAWILALTTFSRFCSFKTIQWLHRRGIGNRNVLIWGTGDTGKRLQKKFVLVPTLGLNLVGFITDERDEVGRRVGRATVLGTSDQLDFLVRQYKVSEVFVAMPEASEEHLLGVVETLESSGVVHHVVPRFYRFMSHKVRIESLDSIPLITRTDRRPSIVQLALKRGLDIVVSLFLLTFGAPLFVIPAILIKRESPGPVFFKQMRVGRDGKPFRMIKFRTMRVEASGDAPKPRTHDDPRLTRIGKWLRRYSLDELPQVLNVLMGDMSIVGPRPEMPFIVEKYGPLERERLRAKPGLTGLWQISYARGEAIHENMEYDIYYIEHQSFLLDLVIIALTGFAVVKGTGAY